MFNRHYYLLTNTDRTPIGIDDLGISNDERYVDGVSANVDDMVDMGMVRARVSHVITSPFLQPAMITAVLPIQSCTRACIN